MTTVLIYDERRGTRDRLYEVMAAVPTIDGIDSVHNADELVTQFGRQPVDMVVIGTQRALPFGIDTMRRLLVFHPQAAVILFGSPEDAGSITAAMACGRGRICAGTSPSSRSSLSSLTFSATPRPSTPAAPPASSICRNGNCRSWAA